MSLFGFFLKLEPKLELEAVVTLLQVNVYIKCALKDFFFSG